MSSVHATADEAFFYHGGTLNTSLPIALPSNLPPYPGAVQSVQTWAAYNGARDALTDPAPSMDLDGNVPGLDTVVMRYTSYLPGGAVELWSIIGGGHVTFAPADFSALCSCSCGATCGMIVLVKTGGQARG